MFHSYVMRKEADKNLKSEQILNHKKLTFICNSIQRIVAKGKKRLCLDEEDAYASVNEAELIYLKLYGYQVEETWWGIVISWR